MHVERTPFVLVGDTEAVNREIRLKSDKNAATTGRGNELFRVGWIQFVSTRDFTVHQRNGFASLTAACIN